ncbi:MAG: prepilin-type N-terminal cleavage/methylation domain-containing protein [Candidatus Omnitrophica bacterium]|nr:prepilin-type N-terminal cleavage/methylation domain-containing protein [Candidatus Omnitrophota bacterium]
MTTKIRRGQPRFNQGFSIVEMAVVMTVIMVLLSVMLRSVNVQVNDAKVKRTFKEMISIAQAVVRFYQEKGAWPADLEELKPDFIDVNIGLNPFQVRYVVTADAGLVKVSTDLPKGKIQGNFWGPMVEVEDEGSTEKVTIAIRDNLNSTDWLEYEKKYTYKS